MDVLETEDLVLLSQIREVDFVHFQGELERYLHPLGTQVGRQPILHFQREL